MVSTQPVQLWHYIGFKKNNFPKNLRRLFYLSWEDAFWDLLDKKKISKGSLILIPDFYCGDVVKNILQRGYKIRTYKILKNLRVDKNNFMKTLHRAKPKIVIVFHPVGIESNLLKDNEWIKEIPDDVLLIEDNVHKVTDPNKIKILKKNHFVIDSLRKVVPMQGANIYGSSEDLNYDAPPFRQSLIYSIKVHTLWLLMITTLNLKFFSVAEKLMKTGYDLIGDEYYPAPGLPIFKFFFDRINYKKIHVSKESQIKIYKRHVKRTIRFSKYDWSEMRGYPLILNNNSADRVLEYLRNNNLMCRFELVDCEWSKKQKVIYLPLGPYLGDAKIQEISELVVKSLNI